MELDDGRADVVFTAAPLGAKQGTRHHLSKRPQFSCRPLHDVIRARTGIGRSHKGSMESQEDLRPANDNSLTRDAAIALRLLHWFLESREEAIAELIGPNYRPDPLRDELMRVVCLNFTEGAVQQVIHYQDSLASRHSQNSVALALQELAEHRLVLIETRPEGSVVLPTKRLVSFYNQTMPQVLEMAIKVLSDVPKVDHQRLPN